MTSRPCAPLWRNFHVALLVVVSSAACTREYASPAGIAAAGSPNRESAGAQLAYATEKFVAGSRQAGDSPAPANAAAATSQPGDPISYLAYAYTVSLELPGEHLTRTMEAHAAACRDAGPRVCQVIAAQRAGDPASQLGGTLAIRAEPQWLQRFMTGAEGDARSAGGRVVAKSTTTEDLTRAIVDTEAALRAKKSLRGRLEQLLASRPGKLADFLDVERELARVQGEIDSTESTLAAMRTRVAMSSLTLHYSSRIRAMASDTFAPLGRALAGFIGYVVNGVAAIVTLVAVGLPWMVVGVPIAWLIVRARRRAQAMGRPAPPPMAVEPPAAPAS